MLLVRLARRPALVPIDELVGRLSAMERRLAGGGAAPKPVAAAATAPRHPEPDRLVQVYEVHQTGTGGRSLEELVRTGRVAGVLDSTTTELVDELARTDVPQAHYPVETTDRKNMPVGAECDRREAGRAPSRVAGRRRRCRGQRRVSGYRYAGRLRTGVRDARGARRPHRPICHETRNQFLRARSHN